MAFPKPMPLPISTNAPSPAPLIYYSLSPSQAFLPYSLPVEISNKYSADLMIGYNCNKLIESKRMFHLGITHNIQLNFNVKIY